MAKKLIYRILCLSLTLLTAALYGQTTILETSFEENNTGTINQQGDWQVDSGSATVIADSALAHSGERALQFSANNQTLVVSDISYSGSEAGVSGVVYVDVYVKIDSMVEKDFAISGYDLFGGSAKRAFVLEFDTPSGNTGMFRIYDGSSKHNIQSYQLHEWNRISARIDYDHAIYQVVFNGSPTATVSFREDYTPTASGSRQAGIKEYHELRFNLGYNGATGTVASVVDDIYIGTQAIDDIVFAEADIKYTIDVEQPQVGSITLDPVLNEYPDSTQVTATLTVPAGYINEGWTGDLSGTELVKSFMVTANMTIGAVVGIDTNNPPPQYTVTVIQPDTGQITLSPPGGIYYDYTTVTATLSVPAGFLIEGWTGDLSGTDLEKSFVIHQDMTIGANLAEDTTPPTIYTVSSASELREICKGTNLKPGDIVEVADGRYDTGGGITVESSGTSVKPIIIRAKNTGSAELAGSTYFTLRKIGYLTIEGFHFTTDAYTAVKLEGCHHIRITANTFQLTETVDESGKWLYIGGYWDDSGILSHHNRVDHNIFRDKHELGNYITIDGGDNVSQYDRIDHNYFYNIGPRHDNEMEAIRVGWSALSLTDGFTVIEHNLFEECDGDPEIISVKSCKDTVRYNTIRRCQGTVSLRHGDGSVVYGNYFLGEGKTGTGGVRLYARYHKIYNNYFAGLTGSKWDAAITLTNGDTDTGSLSAHWRIDDVVIANNTLVDNYSNIEIGYAKEDGSWKKEPRNVTMANNLVLGGQADLITIYTTPDNFSWSDNIMYPQNGFEVGMTLAESQIRVIDPLLVRQDSLWLLSSGSPAINACNTSYSYITDDVQGQPRSGSHDVGADEYSVAPVLRTPLQPDDVGPSAGEPQAIAWAERKPVEYILFRNYPNPFNPVTTLQYQIAQPARVRVDIYTVIGQKVATLVNQRQNAGIHSIVWDAKGLSSGVYLAVLKAGENIRTSKLLLMK